MILQVTKTARISREPPVDRATKLHDSDRAACDALYQQYGARMLAVARRMLRSEEDAADAVQDAFLAAFVSLPRFRAEAQISTWLHRIVVNKCLMRLRSQKRRPTVSLESIAAASKRDDAAWPAMARECDDAATLMDKREQRTAIRRSIQSLPDSYREVLILRDIDQYDTEQTAALLGVSRGAIKTRLHRARQTLGESLLAADCV
ncbi:MAG: RNA polymerase sigma factor [Pirellulales bacterium]